MNVKDQHFNDCLLVEESSRTALKDNLNKTRERQGGITFTFPIRLYSMLQELSSTGVLSDIVKWSTTGDSFVILKPKEFTKSLLPQYFRTHKFSSFQRQLNAYGFTKFNLYACQDDYHVYYHKHFLRGNIDRLSLVKRKYSPDRIEFTNRKREQKSFDESSKKGGNVPSCKLIKSKTKDSQKYLLSKAHSEQFSFEDTILDQAVAHVIEEKDADLMSQMIDVFNSWNPESEFLKNNDVSDLATEEYSGTKAYIFCDALDEYSDLDLHKITSEILKHSDHNLWSPKRYNYDEDLHSDVASDSSSEENKRAVTRSDENGTMREMSDADSLCSSCLLLLDEKSEIES
jgi:hypothetical protein